MLHACSNLRRAGATSLEFALVLLAFLVLLLGIVDVSRYLYTLQAMSDLASRAARAGVAGTLAAQSCQDVSSSPLPFTVPPLLDPATQLCVTIGNDTASGATTITATVTSPYTSTLIGNAGLSTTSDSPMSVTTELKY